MAKKEVGEFGTIYTQFKNRPKEAIKHLKKVKEGECVNAFYREDIGYVDLVWGEIGTARNNYKDKKFILSAFDLRPISKKNPKRAKEIVKRGK